jgi:hypothetical protein
MWKIERSELSSTTHRYRILTPEATAITYKQAIGLWIDESPDGQMFRLFTSLAIASSPFAAFCWELPPVKGPCSAVSGSLDREFEFVLVDSSGLNRPEDPTAFEDHFSTADGNSFLTFKNLNADATMIVPSPTGIRDLNHCHLASFLRTADQSLTLQLWQTVGQAMHDRLEQRPTENVWLSTSGLGVAWLHVRLDDQPKYYQHADYQQP